jgi:hypothetical protein
MMRRHRPNGEARPDQPDNQTASQTRPTGMVQRLKKGTLTTHTLTFTLTHTHTLSHSRSHSRSPGQVKSQVRQVTAALYLSQSKKRINMKQWQQKV